MYNGVRYLMETVSRWKIWHWCRYICDTMVMALRNQKRTCGCTGEDCYCRRREERIDKKTRRVFEQSNQSKRFGDKYVASAGGYLTEKERRIIEQNAEIAKLQSSVLGYIVKQYQKGEVDVLPDTKDLTFKVSDGVSSKMLLTDSVRTIYLINFEKGGFIPSHNHSQSQHVQVIEGELRIDFTELERSAIVKKGESLYINAYLDHVSQSEKGAVLISVFEPPIVHHEG